MNVIFMGTPDFAVESLRAINQSHHKVVGVFSQGDKPKGRGYTLSPPAVKVAALELGYEVFQPKSLKDGEALEIIKKLHGDIIVVVAYGKILPKEILNAVPRGCVNVHGSLLPKYRGAAPIQRAVLDGENETGVTVMQMGEGLDTGDMLLVEKTSIGENETSAELFQRMSNIGANALIKALDLIEKNKITAVSQDNSCSSYASMIDKSMCPIDWSRPALSIHNQIRGLSDWPVATTKVGEKTLKIYASSLSDENGGKVGEVIKNKNSFIVSCGDGKCVELLIVQFEGKKRMKASDFLCGNPIKIGQILGG